MVKIKPERCKQCEMCIINCPKEAISFGENINSGGYRYTVINHEKCIGCGICYTVCPDGVYEVINDK